MYVQVSYMSLGYRTFSNHIFTRKSRCVMYLYTCSGWQRTSSNLYEPIQYRESMVCRGLSQAFEVVRLYRTFSNHIFTRGSRCVWYLYTCSGWFNRSEPLRTFSNHFSAEKARCVEVYHMNSGWFDYTDYILH